MAYLKGSASTTAGLIQAVVNFAVANGGFTAEATFSEMNGTTATGYTIYPLTRAGSYWFLAENGSSVFMVWATGKDTTLTLAKQPGGPGYATQFAPCTPPYTAYHLFVDSYSVRVAVEVTPGRFNHFAFGTLSKFGTWTGGEFVTAGNYTYSPWYYQWNSNGHQRVFEGFDSDQPNPGSIRVAWNTLLQASLGTGGNQAAFLALMNNGNAILDRGPNPFNLRAGMTPAVAYLNDQIQDLRWRPLGYVPGVRMLNIQNLEAEAIVNTDFMVFPLTEKNGAATTYPPTGTIWQWPNSYNYGIAFQQ